MKTDMESNEKGGLYVLDSMSADEFQNLVRLFSLLLQIDQRLKDVQGDSNSEEVPLDNKVK